MKIRPLQDRVLVKRLDEQKRRPRAASSSPTRRRRSPSRARSSRSARARSTTTASSRRSTSRSGDTILFGKYAGTEIKLDGVEHLIMREEDILGVVES